MLQRLSIHRLVANLFIRRNNFLAPGQVHRGFPLHANRKSRGRPPRECRDDRDTKRYLCRIPDSDEDAADSGDLCNIFDHACVIVSLANAFLAAF